MLWSMNSYYTTYKVAMKPIKQQGKIKRSNSSHQLKTHPKLSKRRCPKLSLTPITSFFKSGVVQPQPTLPADPVRNSTNCSLLSPPSHTSLPQSPTSHRSSHHIPLSHRSSPHSSSPLSPLLHRSLPHSSTHHRLSPHRSSPHSYTHHRPSPHSPLLHRSLPHSSTHHRLSPHRSSPHSSTHHRPSPHRSSPHKSTPCRSSPHSSRSPHKSTHHRPSSHRSSPHKTTHHRPSSHRSSPHNSTHHRPSPHRSSPHNSTPRRSSPHRSRSPHKSIHCRSSPHRSRSPHKSTPNNSIHHRCSPHRSSPHRRSPHKSSPHRCSPHRCSPHRSSPHKSSPHRCSPHRSCSPKRSTPKRSTPHRSTPHSSTSKHPRLSPVSRSSAKKNRNLTPVKLSSNFEFDFIKIRPPVNQSTAHKGSRTPPSSLNSSPIAPLFSPISTPSTPDLAEYMYDLYAAIKTPCIGKLSSEPDHTEELLPRGVDCERNKSVSKLSNSINDTIVISSDSDREDIHKRQGRRKPKCTLGKVDESGVIIIDCSSESDDLGGSERKKVCIVDLSDSIGRSTRVGISTLVAQPLMVDDKTIEENTKGVPTNTLPAPSTSTCSESKEDITTSSDEPLSYSATGLEVLPGEGNQMRTEVESLLWKRGVTYSVEGGDTEKVVLLSTAQNTVTECLLDTDCRFLSDNIYSLVEYLSTITSNKIMPTGESLAKLILIISETHSKGSQICPKVRNVSLSYLGQLLLLHPPGQHTLVDSQYRSLLTALEEHSDSFSLWEFLDTLSKGPTYCLHLLSLFVDLFLADYWNTLQNDSCGQPLFLDVFWTNKGNKHVTTPIRNLLDSICELLDNFNPTQENILKLDSLVTLLYLCSTQCEDLSQELLVACKRLHPEKVIFLLGRLHSTSLHSQIIKGLPELEQELRKPEQIFNAMISKCTAQPRERTDQVLPIIVKTEPDDHVVECNFTESVLELKKSRAVDVHSTQSTSVLTKNSVQPSSIKPPIVKPRPVNSHQPTKYPYSRPATTTSTVNRTQGTAKRPAVPTSAKFKGTNNFTMASTTSTLDTKNSSSEGSKVCHMVNGSSKVNVTTTKRPASKQSTVSKYSLLSSTSTVVQPKHNSLSQKTSLNKQTTGQSFGKTVTNKTLTTSLKSSSQSKDQSSTVGSKVIKKRAVLPGGHSKQSGNGRNFLNGERKFCENCKTGSCVRCVQQRRMGVNKAK